MIRRTAGAELTREPPGAHVVHEAAAARRRSRLRRRLGCRARAQPLAQGGFTELSGSSGRTEIEENLHEAPHVVSVGEMTCVREHLEPAASNLLVRRIGMPDGDERVSLSPHDKGRQLLGEIQSVARTDPLTACIEDAAYGREKSPTSVGVAEGGESLPHPFEIGTGAESKPSEPPGGLRDHVACALRAEPGQHDPRTRENRRAEEGMDLASQAAA